MDLNRFCCIKSEMSEYGQFINYVKFRVVKSYRMFINCFCYKSLLKPKELLKYQQSKQTNLKKTNRKAEPFRLVGLMTLNPNML